MKILIAAWVAYVAFVGPWLISAPSWIAVGLGFAILLGLLIATFKRTKIHYE
jgi:hypothetical protein